MSEEYTLVRDIVYDHNERMLNIRKYYPFFKLADISLSQYKEGKFAVLDMGYIVMAVLRFFIEENNFREKMVTYNEYMTFMQDVLKRDFELVIEEDEEKELIAYIFDKLKNDGKPFSYEYFDPVSKQRKTVRTKILDNKIVDDNVVYYITSDAIEFYLDTKEIKDESNITIAQVLLTKMISTRNFKGGTEVVSRINNEVSRLISKKNEILGILSYDIFEGIKAYESFIKTTVKWFDEEQKLFDKNKQLIEQALRAGEEDNKFYEAMEDIYHLESELNRAMNKHSELLNACTILQAKADEMVVQAKFNRLKSSFDFRKVLSDMIKSDNTDNLNLFTKPLLKLNVKKTFSLTLIDNMLNMRTEAMEDGEKVNENKYDENFKYDDEIEDERIYENHRIFLMSLFDMLIANEEFDLMRYNEELVKKLGKNVLKNGDYYSFVTHLCQKSSYDMSEVIEKPDTFLEGFMKKVITEESGGAKYKYLTFRIDFPEDNEILENMGNEIVNVHFRNGAESGK
jgi:hypothetical protein